MSLLFSQLNKSDMIYEDDGLSSESTPTGNSSLISHSLSKCCDLPSKKSMLRQLNSSFKQEMSRMDACFQEVGTKYSHSLDTSNSHLNCSRNCGRTISSDPAYTRPTNAEYIEPALHFNIEKEDTPTSCYQQAVKQQHKLQRQLVSVAQLIAKRSSFGPSELQKIGQERAPIKWNLLMRQHSGLAYRELFQTSINTALSKVDSQDYIAYTEESSREQINPLKRFQIDGMDGAKQYEIYTQSNQQSKSQIYRSIQNRVLSSPCTMKKGIHDKQISRTSDLFNRLSKQKRQREELLKAIKISMK